MNYIDPNPAAYARRPPIPKSNPISVIKVIAAVVVAMFAALLGLIILLLIGAETGLVELVIGMICATLPVPIYVMLLLWIDRYESEPLWMLATSFLWGAIIAVFISLIFNTGIALFAAAASRSEDVGEAVGAVISAPIVEESAKALILVILFFWKKDEFDGIVDGIVYAGMVGLGFAMTENILYYGRAMQKGADFLTAVWILRGMAAPFSHPLFTSMTGIGLGWARQSESTLTKFTVPFLGFGLAVLMHAAWNGSAVFGGGAAFFVTYFMVMGPALIITLMVIHFQLKREGRIVQQYLYPDYQKGHFDQHEFERLCTVRGRMGLSWNALRAKGFSGWRLRRRCNQMASELAFHRSRVARGLSRHPLDAAERDALYHSTLHELRRQLGLRQGNG
jgi:RsiW-degrading membrane proteinase PrsW (M82 family)